MNTLTPASINPSLKTASDEQWMQRALDLAKRAASEGEVPVGAVLVQDDHIIAEAHNQPIALCDPSAHAELLALRQAANHLKNYRLLGTTLYVTLEPCAMCVGAMVHARIQRLVIGASDPKTGACGGAFDLINHTAFNHKISVTQDVLAEPCGQVLKTFFQQRR